MCRYHFILSSEYCIDRPHVALDWGKAQCLAKETGRETRKRWPGGVQLSRYGESDTCGVIWLWYEVKGTV